ncbi:hypothetical protein MNBD_BACTEROID06-1172, partial [hydrothermal vent metagenome]
QPTPHMMFLFISSQVPLMGPTVGASGLTAMEGGNADIAGSNISVLQTAPHGLALAIR